MRAIGQRSISSILKVVVDIAWVVTCAALGFIWIVVGLSVFGGVSEGGAFAGIERIVVQSPYHIVRWGFMGTVVCVSAMVIFSYLRGIFATLVNGDPFVPENAGRLRMIALVVTIVEVIRMALSFLIPLLFTLMKQDAGVGMNFTLDINGMVWFSVLTLVVLAQVFSEGTRLREEQKMTI